jgi:hypothetical protein
LVNPGHCLIFIATGFSTTAGERRRSSFTTEKYFGRILEILDLPLGFI